MYITGFRNGITHPIQLGTGFALGSVFLFNGKPSENKYIHVRHGVSETANMALAHNVSCEHTALKTCWANVLQGVSCEHGPGT